MNMTLRGLFFLGIVFGNSVVLGPLYGQTAPNSAEKAGKTVNNPEPEEEEEGPFSQALKKRDWGEVNKLFKSTTRHGMAENPEKRPESDSTESLSSGKALFEEYCVICHGSAGKGDGIAAQHLITKPANLQEIAKRFPDRMFFMQISKGKGDMPSWFDMLTQKEISQVTKFVRSLGKK
jgi:mono/diheme cytochrome c family protein